MRSRWPSSCYLLLNGILVVFLLLFRVFCWRGENIYLITLNLICLKCLPVVCPPLVFSSSFVLSAVLFFSLSSYPPLVSCFIQYFQWLSITVSPQIWSVVMSEGHKEVENSKIARRETLTFSLSLLRISEKNPNNSSRAIFLITHFQRAQRFKQVRKLIFSNSSTKGNVLSFLVVFTLPYRTGFSVG